MQLNTDKNIPIPTLSRHSKWAKLYDFGAMAIGDSVLIPPPFSNNSVRSKVNEERRKTGFNFLTRKEGDSTRVWRIT